MSISSKRDYPSSPDVHYLLPSDAQEKQRLDLQHTFIRRALCDGKNVLAPIVLKLGDRVLDSGTGSGAWVLSLAEEVPSSVSLTAIDIQSKIVPKSSPQTLINQRFLYGSLTGSQWEAALQELHRVIAPGGWVQLVEGTITSGRMGPFSLKISKLWSAIYAHKGLLVGIGNLLPDMLTKAGFVNVWGETRALPLREWAGTDGTDGRDDLTSLLSAMSGSMVDFGLVSSEQEYEDLIACVRKEWDNGREISASHELTVMYAQKPFL